ncbi:MAG: aldo/keto reductase [Dehalococcoidia bacterium]
METRILSQSDLSVSRLVLGTMTFGSQVDVAEARSMVDLCLDAGVTMFDTANAYNAGRSEEILGEVLKGRRNEALIATKAFMSMGPDADDSGLHKEAIFQAVDASLRRLQTDHIDLFYFHQPDWQTPIEESLEALNSLIDSGKIRYGGTSNFAAWQIADILCLSDRKGWQPVCIAQQMYNLLSRRIEEEYAAFSINHGVSNIVYNPLAGGLLTGKHQLDSDPELDSRFTAEMYRKRYWNDAQFAAVGRLKDVAGEAGLTLVELSFRWLFSQPLVDAVLVGASRLDQLRTNLAAAQGPQLPKDVMEACDQVWQTLRGAAPSYNR